jgi:hypothetical protein
MHIIKILLSLALAVMVAAPAHAQPKAKAESDQDHHDFMVRLARKSEVQNGMAFVNFSAHTPGGAPFNNRNLTGKISLILFWYPSISTSQGKFVADYLNLGQLPQFREQCKFFQIVSLMPDTSGLALFRQQHPERDIYTVATLQSHAPMTALNGGMGMPSCVLVDRDGKVVRRSFLGRGLDEDGLAGKIRELMLQ